MSAKPIKRFLVRLTEAEISALLAASGNVDVGAMAEDCETEEEGDAFMGALETATKKLHEAKS